MALNWNLIPTYVLFPNEAAAWYLQNPLLLAEHPALMARRASELADFSEAQVRELASKLSLERTRLRLKLTRGYEGALAEQPDWVRFEELMQSNYIEKGERVRAWSFGKQCHASEWPWLVARVEAELLVRIAKQEAKFLETV